VVVYVGAFASMMVGAILAGALGVSSPPGSSGGFETMFSNDLTQSLVIRGIGTPIQMLITAVGSGLFLGGIRIIKKKIARGQRPEFGEVFGGIRYFGQFFIAQLVLQLAGLLCCIPGLILQIGCAVYGFCIVDRGLGGVGDGSDELLLARLQ